MLAAFSDFLFPWQFPVMLLFAVGWVFGGGYLLRRGLRKQTGNRRLRYGRCAAGAFLAGLAGLFAGGVMFIAARAFGAAIKTPLIIPGAIVAGLAVVGVSFLTIYAMFGLSGRQTLAVWSLTFGVVAGMGLVLAVPSGLVSYKIRYANLNRTICQQNLLIIHQAIFQRYGFARGPDDLRQLVELNALGAKDLKCPARPDREMGYFYLPSATLPTDRQTLEIRAADFADNGHNGRNVLFINGRVAEYSEKEFQDLLARPENRDFADALREAEKR